MCYDRRVDAWAIRECIRGRWFARPDLPPREPVERGVEGGGEVMRDV